MTSKVGYGLQRPKSDSFSCRNRSPYSSHPRCNTIGAIRHGALCFFFFPRYSINVCLAGSHSQKISAWYRASLSQGGALLSQAP